MEHVLTHEILHNNPFQAHFEGHAASAMNTTLVVTAFSALILLAFILFVYI